MVNSRKIQLVAGSTYSVSLPKEWVLSSGLREGMEVLFEPRADGSLSVLPNAHAMHGTIKKMSLDIGEYRDTLDQAMFSAYYLGAETIALHSKDGFSKDAKARIRKVLSNMVGAEISSEDPRKIAIHVLVDKSRIQISALLSRTGLLIDSMLSNLPGELSIEENDFNETEVDKLYHLLTKMVMLSLTDAQTLESSGIRNFALIPSYFLIAKKLENIGDNANYLCRHLCSPGRARPACLARVTDYMKRSLGSAISQIVKENGGIFTRMQKGETEPMQKLIGSCGDAEAATYLENMLRLVVDIDEEATNIFFYRKLIEEKML